MIKHVKPTRLSVCRGLAAAALGCLALNAFAALPIPKGGRQPFSVETQSGNLQVYSVMGTSHSGTYFKNPSVSTSSPSVSANVPMPFANKGGTSSDATLTWPVSPEKTSAAAAKSLEAGLAALSTTGNGYVAVASVVCVFVCQPAIEALTAWGADQFKKNDDGSVGVGVPDPAAWPSTGTRWMMPGASAYGSFDTPYAACSGGAKAIVGGYTLVSASLEGKNCRIESLDYSGNPVSTLRVIDPASGVSSCPVGSFYQGSDCVGSSPKVFEPLQSYLQSNYTGKGWDHHWAGITAGLVAAGVNVFTDGTGSTITGPAVVPVSTSETKTPVNLSPGTTTPAPPGHTGPTDSGTQTTTTTTTAHNTYRPGSSGSGPSMETKTQTQTTTNITNNITNNTSSTVITNTTETDKAPEKEDKDFCEQNPDSLACAETDTPEQETPTGNLNISYEYVDIFGNGSCPSDSYLNTHGQSLKVWDWAATCDNVQSYFRPILIACCAFAAFVIFSAGAKE